MALLAAAIVASITIDLGPVVRARAEDAGSKYIERPLHIGALRIHLLTGKVLVEDLKIDGLHKDDRPFFTAKQIAVALDWLPAFHLHPDITISSVEMTDWQMLVEKWDGSHNFPRFNHDDGKPPGPKRMTTTLRHLRAFRGQFSFEDHETPWSVVCRNLDISIGNLPQLSRHGDVQRRHGHDPGFRPDVGEHEGAVRHRRIAHPSRSHRHGDRRRHDGRNRRRGPGALAESGLPGEIARELSAHARALLQG